MDKTVIVYWSGTGNTETMAKGIADGMRQAGTEVDLLEVGSADAAAMVGYNKLAFGCPSMGAEELEESAYEPFFADAEGSLGGKKVALFGSYGWGDGEWMCNWVSRTEAAGANMMDEGLIMHEAPDEAECVEYGKKFAAY